MNPIRNLTKKKQASISNRLKVSVKVQPKASKNDVIDNEDGSFKVYLKSAPTDGKANKELIALLSDYFKVGKQDVNIITGKTSRKKIIEVTGG